LTGNSSCAAAPCDAQPSFAHSMSAADDPLVHDGTIVLERAITPIGAAR
jgi:hypothetical protein